MMGIRSAVAAAVDDMRCEERDYGPWLDTITEASARLDLLETAVTEVRSLCENGDVSSEQILEVLARHRLLRLGKKAA